MSQKELILDYLKTYGSITPIEALEHCGSFRLSERIRELAADGHYFVKGWATNVSHKTGHVSRVRRYFLYSAINETL